jgi:putative transposase
MDTSPATTKYKNYRFPVEIISHAVWLYFRFCLSFRDVEELLCERGVSVTYEAIRKWCRKFGQQYAKDQRQNNFPISEPRGKSQSTPTTLNAGLLE